MNIKLNPKYLTIELAINQLHQPNEEPKPKLLSTLTFFLTLCLSALFSYLLFRIILSII